MHLRIPGFVLLFVVGGIAGLIGDHGHVDTGTLSYLPAAHRAPSVWTSPMWFPALVVSPPS